MLVERSMPVCLMLSPAGSLHRFEATSYKWGGTLFEGRRGRVRASSASSILVEVQAIIKEDRGLQVLTMGFESVCKFPS